MRTKKAQSYTDLIVVVVIIFFIAFLGLIAAKIWSSIDDGLQSSTIDAQSKAASSAASSGTARGFDIGIIIALGLAYIGLFITSRTIQTNPMYFFINIFFLVLALGFAAIMGNVFDGTNTNDFAVVRASMPGLVYVASHLLQFFILAVLVIIIGLFAKPEGGQ